MCVCQGSKLLELYCDAIVASCARLFILPFFLVWVLIGCFYIRRLVLLTHPPTRRPALALHFWSPRRDTFFSHISYHHCLTLMPLLHNNDDDDNENRRTGWPKPLHIARAHNTTPRHATQTLSLPFLLLPYHSLPIPRLFTPPTPLTRI